MRLPFTRLHLRMIDPVAEQAAFDAAIEERAADLVARYAHNSDCLRAAVAGNLGLTDAHMIAPDSMLVGPMRRGIEAFARAMKLARAEPVAPARAAPDKLVGEMVDLMPAKWPVIAGLALLLLAAPGPADAKAIGGIDRCVARQIITVSAVVNDIWLMVPVELCTRRCYIGRLGQPDCGAASRKVTTRGAS